MKHKWHKEIKAWADGAEIEYSYYTENDVDIWLKCEKPLWNEREKYQYRIKPSVKEPQYLYVFRNGDETHVSTKNAGLIIKTNNPSTPYICVGKIKLEVEE